MYPPHNRCLLLLLLLLLSRFGHVRLCVPPQTAAHQAPSSLGLSRQGAAYGWSKATAKLLTTWKMYFV